MFFSKWKILCLMHDLTNGFSTFIRTSNIIPFIVILWILKSTVLFSFLAVWVFEKCVTCKCNTCKYCHNTYLYILKKFWSILKLLVKLTSKVDIYRNYLQNVFYTYKYCDNTHEYWTCKWTHFSSSGSILVSIITILNEYCHNACQWKKTHP